MNFYIPPPGLQAQHPIHFHPSPENWKLVGYIDSLGVVFSFSRILALGLLLSLCFTKTGTEVEQTCELQNEGKYLETFTWAYLVTSTFSCIHVIYLMDRTNSLFDEKRLETMQIHLKAIAFTLLAQVVTSIAVFHQHCYNKECAHDIYWILGIIILAFVVDVIIYHCLKGKKNAVNRI